MQSFHLSDRSIIIDLFDLLWRKKKQILQLLIAYLIFAFEHEHVGHFSEWYAQVYDFGLGDFVGYVAYVYHTGRLVVGSFV